MRLSEVGVVNHREDTRLIRDAALLIDFQRMKIERLEEEAYQLEERIAIMEEGAPSPVHVRLTDSQREELKEIIGPGANVDLWPILDGIEKKSSGLIEEE